ncbi:hypothetical protein AUK22_04425 [bacterium CG2_30_54_10]|nr:MAG: hypothetical protein AUK22_04425 [bacterium CG2_30_54_10]
MSEKLVDAKGMLCPRPLILVKKALAAIEIGEGLKILLDNETACENVLRFLQDSKAQPTSANEAGCFVIYATKTAGEQPSKAAGEQASKSADACCDPAVANKPPVLVLNHPGMGFGSEELGRLLIQACLNTVKELNPLPSAIVFYNGGAYLVCEGSPVMETLRELEQSGVKLLVCGTCLEYYDLKARRKVGTVSNMFDIMQTMAGAGHVINP